MYRKFDVTGNLFLHSALFNGTKHSHSLKEKEIETETETETEINV
jgi:hypothetical protein